LILGVVFCNMYLIFLHIKSLKTALDVDEFFSF
jgi:hypothetical protein